jgi:hypothetical protein
VIFTLDTETDGPDRRDLDQIALQSRGLVNSGGASAGTLL